MRNPVGVWIALAVGGAVMGWGLWSQAGRIAELEAAPAGTPVVAAPSAELAALDQRIKVLEANVEALREDSTPRSRRARAVAKAVAARGLGSGAEVDAPAVEAVVDEAVAAAITGGDKAVNQHLRQLIGKERKAEREARWERRAERSAERVRDMVTDLSDTAELTDSQRSTVETQLVAEQKAVMALFRAAREEGSFRQARDEAQVIRASTEAQIKAALEPGQYEEFEKLREEDGWGGAWRGRGGRDRGRGDE